MILVTGGGGFIGGAVCRLLAERGREVVAVDRGFATDLPCRTERGDVCDTDFVGGLFATYAFEAVVHLASLRNRESQQQPEEALRVNIGASLSLLEKARQASVPRFVFGSSISAYGPKPYAKY